KVDKVEGEVEEVEEEMELGEERSLLLEAGISARVTTALLDVYRSGAVAHEDLDDRALEALKEFNEDGALAVLEQFSRQRPLARTEQECVSLRGHEDLPAEGEAGKESSRCQQRPRRSKDQGASGPHGLHSGRDHGAAQVRGAAPQQRPLGGGPPQRHR
ncbi:unnamed protein product, partial [Lampetra fluviatilis]